MGQSRGQSADRPPIGVLKCDSKTRLTSLKAQVLQAVKSRSKDLKALDAGREAQLDWFQSPEQIAYTGYIDRFSSRLDQTASQLSYLKELGDRYFYPLPLSRLRQGESDDGFAVADNLDVAPRLGSWEDLKTSV